MVEAARSAPPQKPYDPCCTSIGKRGDEKKGPCQVCTGPYGEPKDEVLLGSKTDNPKSEPSLVTQFLNWIGM